MNDRSLEEDFPCEVLFDIREAGDTPDEIDAERLTEFQQLASGRKLKSVRCGSMDSTRTESVDQIPTTLHQTTDSAPDSKAVKTATEETLYVDEYIRTNSLKLLPEDKERLYELVNEHSEELMKKHSNLNSIGISPVLSRKKGFEQKPCIVMYCSEKGNIPLNEPKFRTEIENTPVDVREGNSSLFSIPGARQYNDPLRIGISIGGKDMGAAGTLGPFVVEAENKTSMGFLTCQHVFSSAEVGSQVVQPSARDYEAGTDIENKICGKIQSMSTEEIQYNGKFTGVDVAYVVINQRIPKELKLPNIPEMLINGGILRMGKPRMHIEKNTKVYKLGLTTGLTAGCFERIMTIVKMDQKTYRNVYLVSSETEFASHGDSGSAVFTVNNKAMCVVGLLLGGTDTKKVCYVMPIGAVLQAVGTRLEIHQFNDETGSGVHDSGGDPPGDNASRSLPCVGAEARCPGEENIPVDSRTVTKFAISK